MRHTKFAHQKQCVAVVVHFSKTLPYVYHSSRANACVVCTWLVVMMIAWLYTRFGWWSLGGVHIFVHARIVHSAVLTIPCRFFGKPSEATLDSSRDLGLAWPSKVNFDSRLFSGRRSVVRNDWAIIAGSHRAARVLCFNQLTSRSIFEFGYIYLKFFLSTNMYLSVSIYLLIN